MDERAIEERRMKRRSWRRLRLGAALAGVVLAAPAGAQILAPLGPVLGALPDVGQTVDRTLDRAASVAEHALDPQSLLEARVRRLDDLIAGNRRLLEADQAGDPVVRGEVLAVAPSSEGLAAARAAGFSVLRETGLDELGLKVTVLGVPPGVSAREAVRRLRRLDPGASYDFNHLYLGAGEAAGAAAQTSPPPRPADAATGVRVGLVDTGVAEALPVFAGVAIQQRGFAPGAPASATHGVATASLIAGRLGAFRGAAPGASLMIADIYGTSPAGASAEALARALAWMVQLRAPVINVSLVGPANVLVAAAVRAVSDRGARIVAAVGNDGPAAPPAYPASYPQVIAVTAVDNHGRVLPEAGRALHLDYAAPGAQMSAAAPEGGLAAVRGTSFAAPIVAGRLARLLLREDPAAAVRALAALDREARPAGRGVGRGVVGEDVRLAPGRRPR